MLAEQGFGGSTVAMYMMMYKRVVSFMESNGISEYTTEVGIAFLKRSKNLSPREISREIRCIEVFEDYNRGLPFLIRRRKSKYSFEGEIGELMTKFVKDRCPDNSTSPSTIHVYHSILFRFKEYCEQHGISIQNIDLETVTDFSTIEGRINENRFLTIRSFLQFAFINDNSKNYFIKRLESIKLKRQQKLLSYFTPEEILKVEQSIDRSNPDGKRNYAMILLGSRLGIRSSDIRKLCFSNIDWDNNVIRIVQFKTKHELELPLLGAVGDAIIDYVMHGRPKSELKQIFVTHKKPYREISSNLLSSVAAKQFVLAGIETEGRHVGFHSLRHSLATNLMNKVTPLPVISGILGHTSSESTKAYLSVGVENLLECSLDVPMVDESFYNQKGGALYGYA